MESKERVHVFVLPEMSVPIPPSKTAYTECTGVGYQVYSKGRGCFIHYCAWAATASGDVSRSCCSFEASMAPSTAHSPQLTFGWLLVCLQPCGAQRWLPSNLSCLG